MSLATTDLDDALSCEPDVRALRRYNQTLRNLSGAGELVGICLAVLLACGTILFTLATNYEDAIFDDGTTNICMIDGKTGEITHVH